MAGLSVVLLPANADFDIRKWSVAHPESVFMRCIAQVPRGHETRVPMCFARSGVVVQLPSVISMIILALAGARGNLLSKFEIAEIIWGDRENGGPEYSTTVLQVTRTRHGARLTPLGIRIATQYGVGWRLEDIGVAEAGQRCVEKQTQDAPRPRVEIPAWVERAALAEDFRDHARLYSEESAASHCRALKQEMARAAA